MQPLNSWIWLPVRCSAKDVIRSVEQLLEKTCVDWQQCLTSAGAASLRLCCHRPTMFRLLKRKHHNLYMLCWRHSSGCLCSVRHVTCCCRYDGTGQLYYNLEYTVRSPQFFRHNISVYAARYVPAHFTQIWSPSNSCTICDVEGLSPFDIHRSCREYGIELFIHSLRACMRVNMFVQNFRWGQRAKTTVFLQDVFRAATYTEWQEVHEYLVSVAADNYAFNTITLTDVAADTWYDLLHCGFVYPSKRMCMVLDQVQADTTFMIWLAEMACCTRSTLNVQRTSGQRRRRS